jgi:hypothetical protein
MNVGDVVQISDSEHPWFPALGIVDDVKSWGYVIYILVPQSNEAPHSIGTAYNRMKPETDGYWRSISGIQRSLLLDFYRTKYGKPTKNQFMSMWKIQ